MMNREVFVSLLALDAYNRGYDRGVFANGSSTDENEAGRKMGNATILNADLPAGSKEAGFYAIAYEWRDPEDGELKTVISYRGTDKYAEGVLDGFLIGADCEWMQSTDRKGPQCSSFAVR
ncbi:MAG: hypothetical protein QNI87_15625 [Erythrobacter sp.]|uniref:hypothetical protein n=1 Tax=Erythrobacter sp. TaxID=1042 RepID=UPI0026310E1A|nr:hypothetical protein [Erythrobacter sp.]MDJ0979955.1 hypothetical protein [Erythrobacter sp.]